MKKAIITMIVVFAFVIWPFSGVWQFLSGIIGGGVQESFIYPIYGGNRSSCRSYRCLYGTYLGRNQIA